MPSHHQHFVSDTGMNYHSLAMNQLALGRNEAAEEASLRAVEIHRGDAIEDRARLAASIHGLGRVYYQQRDLEKARELFEESSTIFDEQADEQVIGIAFLQRDIAKVADLSGDSRSAEESYAAAVSALRESLPAGHAEIANAQVDLGRVRCRNDSGSDGLAMINSARITLEASLSADNWQLARVDVAAGECRALQGAFAAAEADLLPSHKTIRRVRGDSHYETQQVLTQVIQLYELWDRTDQADEYRAALISTQR